MPKHTSWTKFTMFISLFGLSGLLSGLAAESSGQVLTTASLVRMLSASEAARQLPVKLQGVVTFYDETLFSQFIQDGTAGIYLSGLTNIPPLLPGQMVEVEGVTGPGEYAPVILPTSVKLVSQDKLPAAEPVSLTQLISGHKDSQLVEFTGIVRAVHYEKESGYFLIDFEQGGDRITVYSKQLPIQQAQDLVDSTVKVCGVCSTMFNHQRQLFGVRVLVPTADGLIVEKPAPANPFDTASQKINSLLQFTPEGTSSDRIKVTGTVVYYEPGTALFIQNDGAGLYCRTLQRDPLQPGDQVEILGFPAKGEYTPILEDVIFQKVGAGTEPNADKVDVNEILTGVHDCCLVQLTAKVLDRVQRGANQFLLLQSGDFTFQAYLPRMVSDDELAAVQNGSEVLITGICMIERGNNWQAGETWRASSFHLLLRSPKDLLVLQHPPDRTLQVDTWILVALGIVALGSLSWVVILRSKLRQQNRIAQRTSSHRP